MTTTEKTFLYIEVKNLTHILTDVRDLNGIIEHHIGPYPPPCFAECLDELEIGQSIESVTEGHYVLRLS